MKTLVKILLFIWQLPQNILALILILIYSKVFGKVDETEYKGIKYVWFGSWRCGVSLGNYVLLGQCSQSSITTICHEYGHTRQSLFFGPLYLILIGIPSGLGNLFDRWFHKDWSWYESYKWYYNQPWEKWADKLGCVDRYF